VVGFLLWGFFEGLNWKWHNVLNVHEGVFVHLDKAMCC
jgi:hypothetical protein